MAKVRSLCVYCGSSNKVPAKYLETAFALGRLMGQAGLELVYGGGRVGLMGRVADGVLVEGGRVTGIIPRHLHDREVAHDKVSELIIVDSMHERKQLMAERADAFAILPGGYGTLDEMFEIVTWRQLGLHDKPIILIDLDGYWQPLEAMIDRMVAEGFSTQENRHLYRRVDRIGDVLPALAHERPPNKPIDSKRL
jgi:uncharacterized protein (TIGR00730 family)